jgi:hypothetical protein
MPVPYKEKEFWEEKNLAIYAYVASQGDLPALLVAREWSSGEHSGVHLLFYYLHDDDFTHARRELFSSTFIEPLENDEHFARLIAKGSIKRVGELPMGFPRPEVNLQDDGIHQVEPADQPKP